MIKEHGHFLAYAVIRCQSGNVIQNVVDCLLSLGSRLHDVFVVKRFQLRHDRRQLSTRIALTLSLIC